MPQAIARTVAAWGMMWIYNMLMVLGRNMFLAHVTGCSSPPWRLPARLRHISLPQLRLERCMLIVRRYGEERRRRCAGLRRGCNEFWSQSDGIST